MNTAECSHEVLPLRSPLKAGDPIEHDYGIGVVEEHHAGMRQVFYGREIIDDEWLAVRALGHWDLVLPVGVREDGTLDPGDLARLMEATRVIWERIGSDPPFPRDKRKAEK